MSKTSLHEQQLKEIIQRIQILDEQTFLLDEVKTRVYHQQPYLNYTNELAEFGSNRTQNKETQKENFIQYLCNTLYKSFYCGMPEDINATKMPKQQDRHDFMNQLSKANCSTTQPDPNWKVYAVETDGSVFVEKNGQLRPVYPNTYFPNTGQNLVVDQLIQLYRQKENKQQQSVFYYVYSDEYFAPNCDIMRIYWNIKAEGATTLIRQITSLLNDYRIPFNFKCLNHPDLYHRSDAAVLYFDKMHLAVIELLLPTIIAEVEAYLNPSNPYFTDEIRPGVSRAEDPGNGQSFGMSRCKYIAEALYDAFQQGTAPKKQLAHLKQYLKKKGIDPKQMSTNPHTQHFLLKK